MAKGIFIIGTDTDVGKTFVSAGIMHILRSSGYNACYFKPVITGVTQTDCGTFAGDAEFVKQACGLHEDTDTLAPMQFANPVSPHFASKLEGKAVDFDVIKDKLQIISNKYDYVVAEGCGGIAVPLTPDYYMLSDLINDMGMDILIVCRSGIGTINHTILTVNYAKSLGISVKGLIANGYSGTLAEDDNITSISKITGIPVIAVIKKLDCVNAENLMPYSLNSAFEGSLKAQDIVNIMGDIL